MLLTSLPPSPGFLGAGRVPFFFPTSPLAFYVPGGTVTFTESDANGTIGTYTVPVPFESASIVTSFSAGGAYDITAVYNGDSNFSASLASPSLMQAVGPAPSVVSVVVNGGPTPVDENGVTEILADQNSVVSQILVTFNEPAIIAFPSGD
jgi:hypothetical protein